ncbi:MAG: UDP-2,4-diacetamido-2,4,6-trideoxy-beta-L-altropyranose hydrolase [Clostridium sp.]|nr:UDP-2,4-diacetamido-2,4,6-trideoxy-beta-L-altropyranose hydrolase [Clostridium sp.]
MKAAIFANGSNTLGMGHIIRTMAIAKVLKTKNVEVEYICSSSSENCVNFILSKKYKVQLEILSDKKYDFIIVDSYDIKSSDEFLEFYKIAAKVIYIDDLNAFQNYDVDILINYAVNVEILKYNGAKVKLLGSKFTPLRKQFSNITFKEPEKLVKDVLITMGAGDEFNYTKYIIEKLLKTYPDLNYKIVIGMTNTHREELINEFQNKKVRFYSNVSNMAGLMKCCDIAISAGGSTIYELCACSVPTIAIVTANNQKRFIENLHKKINLQYVDFTKGNNEKFIDEFNILYENYQFRKEVSFNMNSLVDGRGAERIAKAIIDLK